MLYNNNETCAITTAKYLLQEGLVNAVVIYYSAFHIYVSDFIASFPVCLLFKYLATTKCILPGFVIVAMRQLNLGDETG